MSRLLVICGQLPPPMHGQSLAISQLAKYQFAGFEVKVLPMTYSRRISGVGRLSLQKVVKAILFGRSLRSTIRDATGHVLIYYPPASPKLVPFLRDVLFFSAVGRAAHQATWIYHFHAGGFAEFVMRSRWRKFLARAYPTPATCVDLSDDGLRSTQVFRSSSREVVPYGITVGERGSREREGKKMLFVGNIYESKGVDLIVDALSRLSNHPDACLTIVGGGTKARFTQLKAKIAELNLEARVRLLGVVTGSAKWQEFRDADLFVFPSFYEAEKYPIVLIEAMGMGLPVISTQWRGIPDILSADERCLIPPRDLPSLVERLDLFLRDIPMRKEIGLRLRRRFEEKHSEQMYLDKFQVIFDRAVRVHQEKDNEDY